MVCPREAKRKIGLAGFKNFRERAFKDTPPVAKPVMPIAEAFDTTLARHSGLGHPRFWHPQIVKAQIGRHIRLAVTGKQRFRLRDVGPLCEAWPPPLIILRNWVKLG